MNKSLKKALSAIFALVLILSMSVMTFAATVPLVYYCSVVKTSTNNETTTVSPNMVVHDRGEADTIAYSVPRAVHTFNVSVFPSDFRAALREAYANEGLLESLTIEAETGVKTIAASSPSGVYAVVLVYTSGSGTWSVAPEGGSSLHSGTFTDAPISYMVYQIRNP